MIGPTLRTAHHLVLPSFSDNKTEPLDPPAGAVPGDIVVCDGCTGEPDQELKGKQKVWETLQPNMHTSDQRVATWSGAAFQVTGKGVVTVKSLTKAEIK